MSNVLRAINCLRTPAVRGPVLLLSMLVEVATAAWACSCAGFVVPSCGARVRADTLVFGTVLDLRVESNEHILPDGTRYLGFGHRVATVAVEEDFRAGGRRTVPGKKIEVSTGMGGGDCGYPFRVGERYLIDLYERNGIYSTGICGQTAPEAVAALSLRELRATAAGRRLPDLSGSVVRYGAGQGSHVPMPRGLAGVSVEVVGHAGVVQRLITDTDGVYEANDLTPDDYTVRFDLPAGLQESAGPPHTFRILGVNGTSPVCHASAHVQAAGRITGQVVDEQGAPARGFLSVSDHPLSTGMRDMWSSSSFTGDDGTFSLGPLEDGTYWLYFQAQQGTSGYRLGRRVPLGSGSLTISKGEEIKDLRLTAVP